jgi:Fe-Mn family superoxide dismutase
MAFELPDLPYAEDALEPVISAETIGYHYGKHHQAYVNNLNRLTEDTAQAEESLEALITTSEGAVFNNAAQVWNHSFYWQCMTPNGIALADGALAAAINDGFGSLEALKAEFLAAAAGNFGSGWTWLAKNDEGELSIVNTSNADTPLREGLQPLLTCDVWEHAYYVDYRNNRAQYLEAWWDIVDWVFVQARYSETRAAA